MWTKHFMFVSCSKPAFYNKQYSAQLYGDVQKVYRH